MIAPLLQDLVGALGKSAIPYCHWKGNYRLAGAATGRSAIEGDFDLLIERRYWSSAITVLTQLDFKLALPRWSRSTPGMLHYFGFDSTQEKLVHVHLHSAIFSGENFIDSHCYPFTQLLLQDTESCNGVCVPARGAELLVYVLKRYIRYGSVPDLLAQRLKPEGEQRELQWLQEGSAEANAIDLLKDYFPTLEKKLFQECLQLLNNDSATLASKFRLARRVRKRLRMWSRASAGPRLFAYADVIGARLLRLFNATSGSKLLASGGAVIALAGSPTNTASVLRDCTGWLSGKLIVRSVEAAAPASTWLTLPVNLLLPVLRKLMPGVRARGLASQTPDAAGKAQATTVAALLYALRALCFAIDRQRSLLAMRRAAANGWIVLCDHHSLPACGGVDGPRLRPAAANKSAMTTAYERLRRYEQRLYQQNPRPDTVIGLNVAFDIGDKTTLTKSAAGSRRANNKQQSEVEECLNSTVDCIIDKNAAVPTAETVLCVKNAIWHAL